MKSIKIMIFQFLLFWGAILSSDSLIVPRCFMNLSQEAQITLHVLEPSERLSILHKCLYNSILNQNLPLLMDSFIIHDIRKYFDYFPEMQFFRKLYLCTDKQAMLQQ